MYISGENIVMKPYTPVDAYAVMPMAGGITSGGTGDGNVIVDETRFFWVYDPLNPKASGFTGKGWFCGVPGTPLQYISSDEELLKQFANGRTDLNQEFTAWQEYVNQNSEGNWVTKFSLMIGNPDCVFLG